MQARLAWFYGWTDKDISELTLDRAFMYYEAMTQIQAQDTLVNMNVIAYPHMKQKERSKFHSEINKRAYPQEKKTITAKDMARILSHGRR